MALKISTDGYGGESVWFFCEGCNTHHSFRTKAADPAKLPKDMEERWRKYHLGGPVWTFDGNLEKPTFSPSLLCNGKEPVEKLKASNRHRCHLFLKGGMVQYLSDCTHHLKNKTVPVVPATF